jgi:hypothetical protein
VKPNHILNENNLRITTLCISIWLYIGSLFSDCFYDTPGGMINKDGVHTGLELLMVGWVQMIFHGGAGFVWLANPMLFAAWKIISNKKASLILSSISFLVSLSFLFLNTIANGHSFEDGNDKTQYVDVEITGYGVGYWLWLLSSAIVCIGSIIRLKLDEQVSE